MLAEIQNILLKPFKFAIFSMQFVEMDNCLKVISTKMQKPVQQYQGGDAKREG